MATALQLRRGTTAQNNSFTGAAGELSYDTATEGLRVHDGSTAGGFEILPSGSILPFGGTAAPTAAFLLCNGADVSRTTYARLFAVIATAYGAGNGSSTFGLPDLRDRVPLGKGSNNSTLGAETGSAAASSVITNATTNTGTGTSGSSTSTTGTGTSGSTTAGRTNSTGTFATSAKDSATGTALTDNVNAAHTHTIPGLSVPGLSVPGLSVPSLSVAGHTHTVPALSIPALTTTLPSSVVNYIIKT
tara:strand:+ start:252 stop:989 length:738 start_codon:yes stop_codon:yes gene_type:complete